MNVRTFSTESENAAINSADAGTRAHCRRVAAWCDELARAVRLKPDETSGLIHAALTHHRPDLISRNALTRLMDDLGVCASNAYSDYAESSAMAEEILSAFGARPATAPSVRI